MAVNLPNPGSYLLQLGQHSKALRDALQDLINDGAYLNNIGVATLEAPPFSLAAADAQNIINVFGAVTPANPTVEAIEAFIASTEFIWGG